MTTWFTAHLHLGHRNIIDYCNRPFADVDAMNRALIQNWNQAVGTDDTVWVVGDFALGKIAETLPLAATLHGRKVLVAGNHDRCWSGHGKRAEGWTQRYLDAGFDEVVQGSAHVVLGEHRVLLPLPVPRRQPGTRPIRGRAPDRQGRVAPARPRQRSMVPERSHDQRRCRRQRLHTRVGDGSCTSADRRPPATSSAPLPSATLDRRVPPIRCPTHR